MGGFASVEVGLGPLGVGTLGAGLSHVPQGREVRCGLVSPMGSLNWTFFVVLLNPSGIVGLGEGVVFLMPLGGEWICGWDSQEFLKAHFFSCLHCATQGCRAREGNCIYVD